MRVYFEAMRIFLTEKREKGQKFAVFNGYGYKNRENLKIAPVKPVQFSLICNFRGNRDKINNQYKFNEINGKFKDKNL